MVDNFLLYFFVFPPQNVGISGISNDDALLLDLGSNDVTTKILSLSYSLIFICLSSNPSDFRLFESSNSPKYILHVLKE